MIEVGEYVRFKSGKISKVTEVRYAEDYKKQFKKPNRLLNYIKDKYWVDNQCGSWTDMTIVKHSKNIIDLITKGDYINGIKVIQIFYDKKTDMLVPITADRREFYNPEIINSIVTKEQFRNMEYRLRD